VSARFVRLRNALLLFGVHFVASALLPYARALIPIPRSVLVPGMLAALVVSNLIIYVMAGALLARVVDSDRRVAWAIALGTWQAAMIIYQRAGLSVEGPFAAFLILSLIVPVVAAGLGGLLERRLPGVRP
jgi:hypothetical protein